MASIRTHACSPSPAGDTMDLRKSHLVTHERIADDCSAPNRSRAPGSPFPTIAPHGGGPLHPAPSRLTVACRWNQFAHGMTPYMHLRIGFHFRVGQTVRNPGVPFGILQHPKTLARRE